MKKRILKVLAGILVLVLAVVAVFLVQVVFPTINGYCAKVLASSVFVGGRAPEDVVREDVSQYIGYLEWDVDQASATVSFYGLASRTAVFYPGIGVTLLPPGQPSVAYETDYTPPAPPELDPELPWPDGSGPVVASLPESHHTALAAAVNWAFQEPDPEALRRTRAVLVVHDGELVAEKYASEFDQDTPLLGWSMSKSLTSALVGVLVRDGKLDLEAPAPVPEWRGAGDPRGAITLDMLMRMSSGLEFNEDYGGPFADVLHMLYMSDDFGAYTAARPLAHEPDTHWNYASGTSNLISRIVRDTVGGRYSDYQDFPRERLYYPIGMTSVTMEPDPSGTRVGSSYTYATARDWARFGLLFLRDGVWNGQRLLPDGWVDYCTTPAPAAPNGRYGAHWWLNAGEPFGAENRPFPELPPDLYYASGHEGQFVVVVPSRDAVIVRLGLTMKGPFPLGEFTARILDALPPAGD